MSRGTHAAAQAAIDELRSIRSTDPCASIAMTTIKATVHTLANRWLPDPPPVADVTDDDVIE